MKKMNILFILITLILIFGTTNVYALNYDYSVGREIFFNNNHIYTSLSLASNSLTNRTATTDFNFDSNITPTNANFVRFAYSGNIYSYINETNNINLSNINWTETCTGHTDYGATYGNNGRIVYADGTTAQIDYAQRTYLCNNWSGSTGSISGTYSDKQILINNFNMQVFLKTDGTWQQCEMDNGFILCPVINNQSYTGLRFIYQQQNIDSGGLIKYTMQIWRSAYEITTSTQTIINNQNNINNSIQDTKDTITSNTIDSNTNTDNLITIPNSNGKNTILDLLMVPVNFITSIINSFSNSCVSYNLGSLLGTDLILPCINLQNILGSGLYNIIDAIFAFGMIFAFIRSVKKFIQKALLLASDVSSEVSIF